MKYSIFILLFLIYSLIAIIAFVVVRMMRREAGADASSPP